MLKAKEIKEAVKTVGSKMAGGFSVEPKNKKTSHYTFEVDEECVYVILHLNAAGEHHHRDRQRAARLYRTLERLYGLKGGTYDDEGRNCYGIKLKQKMKAA